MAVPLYILALSTLKYLTPNSTSTKKVTDKKCESRHKSNVDSTILCKTELKNNQIIMSVSEEEAKMHNTGIHGN